MNEQKQYSYCKLQPKWIKKKNKNKKRIHSLRFSFLFFARVFCHLHLLQRWKSIFIKMLRIYIEWVGGCPEPWEILLQLIKIMIICTQNLKFEDINYLKITGCGSLPVTKAWSFYAWIKTKCPFQNSPNWMPIIKIDAK